MEQKKRQIKFRQLFAVPLIVLFVVLANLCDTGILPQWMQRPIDAANKATGGLIYQSKQGNGLSVHFINVGQGDSALICCDGSDMLIDGGVPDEAQTVENYLHKCGVTSLNYVVGTHPHDDHIGGLSSVVSDFTVKNILLPDAHNNTPAFENLLYAVKNKGYKITRAIAGNSYNLGGGHFTIIAPNDYYDDLNDMSVVIRFCYKKKTFIFTGDASKASEADILKKNFDVKADVLKVGHHGSDTATTQAFLDAVKPQYGIISVGVCNDYGLPDAAVIDRLQRAGVKILRTDINGTIVFHTDGTKITYNTEK